MHDFGHWNGIYNFSCLQLAAVGISLQYNLSKNTVMDDLRFKRANVVPLKIMTQLIVVHMLKCFLRVNVNDDDDQYRISTNV